MIDEETGHDWQKAVLTSRVNTKYKCALCQKVYIRKGFTWYPPRSKCKNAQHALHSDALPTDGTSAENQPGKAPVS